jgi:hypothetical protein
MMLNYVYYYDYIKNVLAAYLSKRKIVQLSATEFDLILNKIDRELFKSNADQLIYNALKSIGDFFNIGGLDKTKVSPIAVEILLKEKNLVNYLLNLRRAVPVTEGSKKEYDIEEIQKILFAPTPVEPETEKAEVEENLESDEQTESIPVDEQSVKEKEKDVDEETDEIQDEKAEQKTLGQLADDHAAEIENAEMGDLLNSEEEKLIEMYENELKELDDESSIEKVIDETSAEELFEEIKEEESVLEETEETNDHSYGVEIDTEKPEQQVDGTISEKEIVDEMIDDYFVEQSEVDKPGEDIIEKNEIPESSIPAEVETDEETYLDDAEGELEIAEELNSLEDDLLQVFEELDGITTDTPEVADLPEPEQEEIKDFVEDQPEVADLPELVQEEIKDFLEDQPEAGSSDLDLEQKFPGEEELSEIDSIDSDLETVDEIAFTNYEETSAEHKDEAGKDVEEGLEEIDNELHQPDEENEELEEEEQPAEEFIKRKNDLFSYMKRKEIKKITASIFGGDEMDFVTTIEKISECSSYKGAREILKGVFFSYKISPFSKEGVMFTNAVSNYFRQV